MARILLLNGPNLNLLGQREPQIYGSASLTAINEGLIAQGLAAGHEIRAQQSNSEHELIDLIHRAPQEDVAFIIINAGAYTHTSVALRDALVGVAIDFIEVHISNVYRREAFRHHSYLADVAVGVIAGLGVQGYSLALQAAIARVQERSP